MTPEQFADIKRIWHEYKHDDSYNDFGKLNLVAVLGERTGLMIAEIERLRAEVERLRPPILREGFLNWCEELSGYLLPGVAKGADINELLRWHEAGMTAEGAAERVRGEGA